MYVFLSHEIVFICVLFLSKVLEVSDINRKKFPIGYHVNVL